MQRRALQKAGEYPGSEVDIVLSSMHIIIFTHCMLTAACDNPQIVEMLDSCVKGLKLSAQVEV